MWLDGPTSIQSTLAGLIQFGFLSLFESKALNFLSTTVVGVTTKAAVHKLSCAISELPLFPSNVDCPLSIHPSCNKFL